MITDDLFLSILAMDAYNRGYSAGISGLGNAGSALGSATMLNVPLPQGSQAAGFYAVAYQVGGQTIISYRGTDNPGALPDAAGVVGLPGAPA